ncbi:MAG: hypothetical protein ABFE08_09020 [Armatimonadia bacterium]
MAYTATLVSAIADKTPSVIAVTIEYSDGKDKVTRDYRVSEPSAIPRIARDAVAELQREKEVAAYLAAPVLGPVELQAKTFEPTIAEQQERTVDAAKARLRRLKEALDLGLITQVQYDNRLSTVKSSLTDAGINIITLLSQ